mgnify:CR=1 FL=1
MNNFISGLILLAERRIKVGDVIEADGHLGRVMNLGTRCSAFENSTEWTFLFPIATSLKRTSLTGPCPIRITATTL